MGKLFYNNKDNTKDIFSSWSYSKNNYVLFFLGIVMIILGYIIMALGETYSFQSLSLAPVILTIGYLVLIPAALIYREKEKNRDRSSVG